MVEVKISLSFSEESLRFDEKNMWVDLIVSNGCFRLARIKLVGTWNNNCGGDFVEAREKCDRCEG